MLFLKEFLFESFPFPVDTPFISKETSRGGEKETIGKALLLSFGIIIERH